MLLAIQIKDRPAQPVKLVKQRFLDMVPLVELDRLRGVVSAGHKSSRALVLTPVGCDPLPASEQVLHECGLKASQFE